MNEESTDVLCHYGRPVQDCINELTLSKIFLLMIHCEELCGKRKQRKEQDAHGGGMRK